MNDCQHLHGQLKEQKAEEIKYKTNILLQQKDVFTIGKRENIVKASKKMVVLRLLKTGSKINEPRLLRNLLLIKLLMHTKLGFTSVLFLIIHTRLKVIEQKVERQNIEKQFCVV